MKIFKRSEFDRVASQGIPVGNLSKRRISSGSRNLDSLLKGGFPCGLITHIYGPAGSGKTNLCLSTAIQCIKKGQKVLFIDTEGGFNLERFQQVSTNKEFEKKIFLKQPFDFEEQKSVVRALSRILSKDFGLLIVDSIVSLYRLQVDGDRKNILELSRELGKELAWLSVISRKLDLAVLFCNQVYDSFEKKREIVPVGGDVLLYWSKIILELENDSKPDCRIATIKKHPYLGEGKSIKFMITNSGLE